MLNKFDLENKIAGCFGRAGRLDNVTKYGDLYGDIEEHRLLGKNGKDFIAFSIIDYDEGTEYMLMKKEHLMENGKVKQWRYARFVMNDQDGYEVHPVYYYNDSENVMMDRILTFEEFNTYINEFEMYLNYYEKNIVD